MSDSGKDIFEAEAYRADTFASGIFRGGVPIVHGNAPRTVTEPAFAEPPDRGRFGYSVVTKRLTMGRSMKRGGRR